MRHMMTVLVLLASTAALNAQKRQRSPAEIQADLENLKLRVAAELTRVKQYLVYYDQLQGMQVAQGAIQPGDAEARTRGKGQQLYSSSFEDAELQQLVAQHQQAAAAYFARIEQEVASARQWPADQPAETYRSLARAAMEKIRRDYAASVAAGRDPRSSLAEATQVLAWTAGIASLPDDANPFASQFRRLTAAIPDERMRTMMVELQTQSAMNPRSDSAAAVTTAVQQPARPGVTTPPPLVPDGMPPGVLQRPALPPDPAAFDRAHALYVAGRYREALPLYDAAVAALPNHRDALFERAVIRTWLNDLAGARADFATLASRDPNDLESRRLYAICELVAGDPRVGKQTADALLAAQPNNVSFILVAAEAALWNNDAASAQQLLTRARQISPDAASGLYAEAGRFLQAGVPAIALLQFNTVLWMGPEWTSAYYGVGNAFAQLGQTDRAIDAYQRYLQFDTTSNFAQSARQEIQRLQQRR